MDATTDLVNEIGVATSSATMPGNQSGACKTKNPSVAMAMRNHIVQACWAIGRDAWKKGTSYHQRSLAETAMLRFKKILGGQLAARKEANQVAEAWIKAQILNRMTHFGMPDGALAAVCRNISTPTCAHNFLY